MSVLSRQLVFARGWWDRRGFERAATDPVGSQQGLLRRIVKANASTQFGREHGFDQVRSHQDFVARVPIRDYGAFEPYVARLTAGQQRVLTEHEPFMFATTSGTTRNPKLIPITQPWKAELGGLVRIWLSAALRDHPRLFEHGILTITSPAVEEYTDRKVPMGSMSGLTRLKAPWLMRRRFVIPYEVNELTDYDVRYFVIARLAMGARISGILTPNPSTVLRLTRIGHEQPRRLLEAIAQGRLGIDEEAFDRQTPEQQAILSGLEEGLSPDPGRAGFLESILRKDDRLTPRSVWPELALIGCWLGGSVGIQAEQMRAHFGPQTALRDLGFRATEATVTVPLEDSTAAGPVALHANFYEFIREEEMGSPDAVPLLAHQLETGGRYYLLITSTGGLYRYDINDVIEVQGWYRGAPRIAFLRKGRDMVNITGEKLHLNQIVAAAEEAAQETGVAWVQLLMIPDTEAARYDLLLETVDDAPSRDALAAFVRCFDDRLKLFNIEYDQKRKSARLAVPQLSRMKSGWAERKHRRDVAEGGKRDSQYKWPVIQLKWDPFTRGEVRDTLDLRGEVS